MTGQREREQTRAQHSREIVHIALARGPMWTMQLAGALRESDGLHYSDVYQALRALEGQGLVERVPQDARARSARPEIQWRRVAERVVDLDLLQDQPHEPAPPWKDAR